MGPATVNICNAGVPIDELSQQIKSALEKQSLENPNDIPLGSSKEQTALREGDRDDILD